MAAAYRSMIPALGRRGNTASIPWTKRADPDILDNSDGLSADSSRCASRDVSPSPLHRDNDQNNGADGGENGSKTGVEVVAVECDRSECVIQDLLGLRISGSRTAGVFVQGIQAGSVAEKTGQIQIGDQLLQVESICLIGLAPDQAVRALRTTISVAPENMVRLTIAHSWADKSERRYRSLNTSCGIALSKSESALASAVSSISIDHSVSVHRTDDKSPGSPPGSITGSFHPKLNSSASSHKLAVPQNQHNLGAMKLKRSDQGSDQQIDTISTVTTALINHVPSSLSMIDVHENAKGKKSAKNGHIKGYQDLEKQNQPPKRKVTNKISSIDLDPPSDQSSDRKISNAPNLPGAPPDENTAILRHRRKTSAAGFSSAGSTKTSDTKVSCSVNDFSHSISIDGDNLSAKFQQVRQWDSEKTLTGTGTLDDDELETFQVGKKSSKKNDLSHMLSNVQRKTPHRKKSGGADDLPLVSFDQLNRTTPSPTTGNKRSVQSSSSKSSKGSVQSRGSQGSQQLSWQCPVCLDGASRIRRTKRKMMSTACGHVFCNSCVEDVVGKYHICPTCRATIQSMTDVHPIFM